MAYKWKPSKTAKRDFAIKMQEINDFCRENGIRSSLAGDSYYFSLNGLNYRVSNHTVDASNRAAYNEFGEKLRDTYHDISLEKDAVQIMASKTRIIEIYNNLKNGYVLDGRGNIKM